MADGDKVVTGLDVSAEKIREKFLQKYGDNIKKNLYDDRDVQKVQENDSYLETFFRKRETVDEAVDRLHESLKWRMEFGMNDMTEDNFERQVWEKGAVFFHNHDKDGHRILFLKVKEHRKDPQTQPVIKRFFAFHLETFYRHNPEEKLVILFDMTETGLSNLDMELIKFVITSFKIYYPVILDKMLIYEMPWVFNAAWTIIKTWLSAEAVNKIKFAKKADIQEYINKDQLMEHMGGTDKFQYEYDPQEWKNEWDGIKGRKKVTFADQENNFHRSFSMDSIDDQNPPPIKASYNFIASKSGSILARSVQKQDSAILGGVNQGINPYVGANPGSPPYGSANQGGIQYSGAKPGSALYGSANYVTSTYAKRENREDNSFIGRLLTISPAEELAFIIDNAGKEAGTIISLKNTLPYSIAYKVKTTSPEKYRVRPSFGVVKAGTTVEVVIILQQEYFATAHKDKFLIMAMEMTDGGTDNVTEIWKNVSKESIMEHRLRCVVTVANPEDQGYNVMSSAVPFSLLAQKVDVLLDRTHFLQTSVQRIFYLQLFLIIVVVIGAILYGFWPLPDQRQTPDSDFCNSGIF
ncbi:hypothetical protein CHS0354_007119 [Potamilus streckersoni]|uniref:Motile sperm domain-containing protein 2 n=1 Tax=Potamilus streckersoni TaxID=2493646 RepID=A0AAE0W6S8_9BIVA|nr:hypothetical protein CHS0354_007119 [Potamilus streckersoni]